jgi:hypothetical protein
MYLGRKTAATTVLVIFPDPARFCEILGRRNAERRGVVTVGVYSERCAIGVVER